METQEVTENQVDTFLPEIEEMDLSELYENTFITAISTGAREDGRLLAKTIHGPYSFDEMVSEVGRMWQEQQNNSKIYILEKDPSLKPKWLDMRTTDYIQVRSADILMDRMLNGSMDKDFTCKAGVNTDEEVEVAESAPV